MELFLLFVGFGLMVFFICLGIHWMGRTAPTIHNEPDEITLLELLEETSEDLIDAFIDKVDDHIDKLYEKAADNQEI